VNRTVIAVAFTLSMLGHAGAAPAQDNSDIAPRSQPLAQVPSDTDAALFTLTAQLLEPRAPLTQRLTVAKARYERLARLIAHRPDVVLRHRLAPGVRKSLPAAAEQYVEEDVTADGELEVSIEDSPDGTSRTHYFVNRAEGRLALHFAADEPTGQTGDRVRVTGVRVKQAMALDSGTVAMTLQAPAVPNTFGAQKTAVILVRFQDKPTLAGKTPAQVYEDVFETSNPRSATNFFKEASYGQAWLEGDVYGIYTIPLPSSNCSTSSIASYARQAATVEAGAAKMATYRRFVYSFSGGACPWAGYATIGGNPSHAWIPGDPAAGALSHEMGHNFGLYHSHGLLCDGGNARICANGHELEYGDSVDSMGGQAAVHFNAVQKERLGWLNYGESPPITTIKSSGVYTLDPYQTVGINPKAIKVKTPSGDWYYIEYRTPLGFDRSSLLYNDNVTNGALVHRWFGENPDRINLIYMTVAPLRSAFPALEVGSTFSDPASGITITPLWADDTLGVNVSVGGAGSPCVRKHPTVTVSPARQQGKAGTVSNYTVSLINNDSGCPPATFTHQATVPEQWSVSFSAATLSIAAGASGSSTMQVTASSTAAAGSYAITLKSANAAEPANTASTTATFEVRNEGTPATFTDNFNRPDSGALGNGWTQVSGSLAISGNRAASPVGFALNVATQPDIVGATQAVTARFASNGNNSAPQFGLLTRFKDAANYYTCYRRTGGTSILRIAKVVGGAETVLTQASIANPRKTASFSMACHAEGDTLTLTLNGVIKLTVSDSSFASGSVGLTIAYRSATGASAAAWADDFSTSVR